MKSFKISVRRSAFFILIITAAFSIFSISALWIYSEINKSNNSIDVLRDQYISEQKKLIKDEVQNVVSLIDFSRKSNDNDSIDELKLKILNHVSSIRLQHGGYIFINTYDGKALIFDGVKIIGEKDVTDMTDPDGLRIFDIEMEAIKNPKGDFFWYKFKRLDTFSPVPKVSYVYGYEDWQWIIGAGIYLEDIQLFILNKKNEYQAILFKKVLYIILLFTVLLFAILAVSFYLSGFIRKEFAIFTSFFHKNPTEDSFIEYKKLHIEEFKALAHSANIMIKQRRVAEILLKKERDKAHSYLNVAGVIILALDENGIVTLINEKGCETLGYNENEILGKNWFNNFVPVSEKQKLRNVFYDRMKNIDDNSFANIESKTISSNGDEKVISWNNTILTDTQNNIIGSLSSGLDITESKRVKESFDESEKKYQLLFEKTNDPVLIIGQDNTFIDCNDAALKILGLSKKSELLGSKPDNLSPTKQPDGKPSFTKSLEMIENARKDGFTRFEWLHQDINHLPFYVDVSLTAIPISGVEYLYVVWRNITEKKKQDEELIIAKEKAEQSDNIKTSFLHNMQHEIRTPLNAIMGFAQLLKFHDLSEQERDDFHSSIISSGAQLTNIIDTIIDFSRLQAGYVLITNETIELKNLLIDIFLKYQYKVPNNLIQFTINSYHGNNSSFVRSDLNKIRDIIHHLLDNAFKFTESGSIELSYNIEQESIVFEVTDTGVGIHKRHFESIFGGFNRVTHNNTEKLYGGNGLGLSISKSILTYMGGNIWVDSHLGKGSKFSFSVPYRPVNIDEVITNHDFTGNNITIVTTNVVRFDRIKRISDEMGINTTHIVSGIEAIEFCQNNYETDLMIMDMDLTGMNGITATKAIKAFNKSLPIIAFIKEGSKKFSKENTIIAGCSYYILESTPDTNISHAISLFLIKDILTKKNF